MILYSAISSAEKLWDVIKDRFPEQFLLDEDELRKQLCGGWQLALWTLTLTFALETYSFQETVVEGVWKQPNGKRLYLAGIMMNFINHIVLGIPTYVLAVFFCRRDDTHDKDAEAVVVGRGGEDGSGSSKVLYQIVTLGFEVTYILIAHSIQYYYIHRSFHEHPRLYKMFHRFHHKFNVNVPPSSANAVTVGEYLLAYVVPFAVATLIGRTSHKALRIAVTIISFFNLVVHTPKFESLIERRCAAVEDDHNLNAATTPKTTKSQWLLLCVTTSDHLNHHRKLHCHYASPTFNIDNILKYCLELYWLRSSKQQQQRQEQQQHAEGAYD